MHFPVGPWVNAAAIVAGAVLGAYFGHRVPARIRDSLTPLFGLLCFGLGIIATQKAHFYAAVGIAAIIGLIIGEYYQLESHINRGAQGLRRFMEKRFPPAAGLSHEAFLDKFIAVFILFTASGTGIFGAMHEGMTGDASILYIKTILDFFTAGIFAMSLGYVVASIAIAQTLLQVLLFLLAAWIVPLTTDTMRHDFAAAGGLLMLATGLRIMGIKSFAVANMLPSLVLIMPLSFVWERFIA